MDTIVSTFAGSGQKGFLDSKRLESQFDTPFAICLSNDNKLYVADCRNYRIRMVSQDNVTTIAGSGKSGSSDSTCLNSTFDAIYGLCCSKKGILYVSDYHNHTIREIDSHYVRTFAGTGTSGYDDGSRLTAKFNHPTGVCISDDAEERIYVCDYSNHSFRMIADGSVT
jgi:sugar lactone lactonase YvrE